MDEELEVMIKAIGLTVDGVNKSISELKRLEADQFGNDTIMQLLQVRQMLQTGVIKAGEFERISTILINNFTRSGYQSGAFDENQAKEWEARLELIAGISKETEKTK
ncbi:MAG: hypothetical protein IJS74_02535 [Clostridia bacterium]|nr:hypothetical protein [Clostridia bacterium]